MGILLRYMLLLHLSRKHCVLKPKLVTLPKSHFLLVSDIYERLTFKQTPSMESLKFHHFQFNRISNITILLVSFVTI